MLGRTGGRRAPRCSFVWAAERAGVGGGAGRGGGGLRSGPPFPFARPHAPATLATPGGGPEPQRGARKPGGRGRRRSAAREGEVRKTKTKTRTSVGGPGSRLRRGGSTAFRVRGVGRGCVGIPEFPGLWDRGGFMERVRLAAAGERILPGPLESRGLIVCLLRRLGIAPATLL